jgi:hypothetical protein
MEKKTVTERFLGQNGLFVQKYKEPSDEVPDLMEPRVKARSGNDYLDALKAANEAAKEKDQS